MTKILKNLPARWLLACLLLAGPALAQLSSRTTVERDFLNYGTYNPYRNHAFEPFSPPPIFGWDAPRYDRLGRYVMQGRVMVSADEQRPGLSKMQGLRFETANVYAVGLTFNYTVLQDSYQGRSYAMMVLMGSDKVATSPVKARFSPLTLNMSRYAGVRFDVNGPKNKGTFIYSRGAGDRNRFSIFTTGQDERSPVILWGGHWETQIGSALRLGSTFINQHIIDTQAKNGDLFKGNLSNDMRSPDLIVVRIVDDSPHDPSAPAAAYDVDVVVSGEDEEGNPRVITNAQELAIDGVEWIASMDPGMPSGRAVGDHWEAAGEEEMIEFAFEMPEEFNSSDAEFIARVGGDYRIQVRQEHTHDFYHSTLKRWRTKSMQWPGKSRTSPVESSGFEGDAGDLKYPMDFKFPEKTPAYTVNRSPGTPRSLAPKEVRFDYGFPTAQSLASLNMAFDYAGFKLDGELVFNLQNFKYPYAEGSRHRKDVTAYYFTGERKLPVPGKKKPLLGLEFYRIPADFSGNYDSRRGGAIFHTDVPYAPPNTAITQEFNLFDDNDDGDQWPDDVPSDSPLAGQNDAGVFPGLDTNNDNVPDTDQNGNGIPDWDEPFLFFWADPPEFIYDIDMNNNGYPDLTENDDEADYPYRRDQKGFHSFINFADYLPAFGKLTLGFYRSQQLAAEGESKVNYLRWESQFKAGKWGKVDFKGDLKRVEDSIPDPTFVWKTSTDPRANSIVLQEVGGQYKLLDLRDPDPDLMSMRNSTVSTFSITSDLTPVNNLSVRLRYKWLVNRQHEDSFADSSLQEDETLSRLTLSHKIEYRYPVKKRLIFTVRGRHLYWQDAGFPHDLRQHWSTYGLLFEEEFQLTKRTVFVAGHEGIPGLLGVRYNQHNVDEEDFKRWTNVLMLRMRGEYLGWKMVSEMGFQHEKKETETTDLSNRTFFIEIFFGF
jgi:hypothetical protein